MRLPVPRCGATRQARLHARSSGKAGARWSSALLGHERHSARPQPRASQPEEAEERRRRAVRRVPLPSARVAAARSTPPSLADAWGCAQGRLEESSGRSTAAGPLSSCWATSCTRRARGPPCSGARRLPLHLLTLTTNSSSSSTFTRVHALVYPLGCAERQAHAWDSRSFTSVYCGLRGGGRQGRRSVRQRLVGSTTSCGATHQAQRHLLPLEVGGDLVNLGPDLCVVARPRLLLLNHLRSITQVRRRPSLLSSSPSLPSPSAFCPFLLRAGVRRSFAVPPHRGLQSGDALAWAGAQSPWLLILPA